MFRALLCPTSGARDYMCVTTVYGVQCLGCWLLEVRCRTTGHASRMRDVAAAPGQQPATKALHTIGGNNTHSLELLMMGIEVSETC